MRRANSPAINMGDLSAAIGAAELPQFDPRGEPFARVMEGRLDMGAFERGVSGDANGDGKVNFVDFVILSDHFGVGQGWGEGNFDGSEAGTPFADFLVLANNFGYEDPGSSTVAVARRATAAAFGVLTYNLP